MQIRFTWLFAALLTALPPQGGATAFDLALNGAERALAAEELPRAYALVMRALERDAKSPRAWDLRARWAAAAGERDEEVYALHKRLRLLQAQDAGKDEVEAARAKLLEVDPVAGELIGMRARFVKELSKVAQSYEKDLRPHSAIRVHKEVLALDPENDASRSAIERLAAAPDPSLAADAKPQDLLADVSEEWIAQFDDEHLDWSDKAKLKRENYTTHTNAGYEVLVRSAEAMEQMNAFYRQFFDFKTDGEKIAPIELNIFKSRDEYLKLGYGPPVEWSGGHFTGGAVETYVEGGYENMVGTLFHEAAHQFVSLATSASGWLNEGLASFFEGCRILPNGTVLMNLPANHRLFPLVTRMEAGWMEDHMDGMNTEKLSDSSPPKAPTFRIVLENKYEWGPPWYAPTWGVVYFLYNYQDPVDGRYVYRSAFREFMNSSGGRAGEGAVRNFQEVVLANPQEPIRGVERLETDPEIPLPETVEELDQVWKDWLVNLRDEQRGVVTPVRPWLRWARAAVLNGDNAVAMEHFEKGLVESPRDVDLLIEFADLLAKQKNTDRATKLGVEAVRELENREEVDPIAIRSIERKLEKWDQERKTLNRVHGALWQAARDLVQSYRTENLPLMVMDVAWRMDVELGVPGMFEFYEEAQKQSGKSLAIWSLAYNERNLDGWEASTEGVWNPAGPFLDGRYGTYEPDNYDYRMLALDQVTGGDFSMEVEVQAERGEVAFCGLVFGRKDINNFHALIYFPPKPRDQVKEGVADSAFVDLTTFYGAQPKVWRHNPVGVAAVPEGQSSTGSWHKLRIDVAAGVVDAWVDGEYMATQEFPTADVLRGSFGLILGPGNARFREMRFLSRHPRDPAAKLERELRMEEVKAESGGSVGGSWQGMEPPFPITYRWVQGERSSWNDAGPVPQLLVLWSIQQNEIVPIDAWLNDLAAKYEEFGLQVVSVCSPNDDDAIDGYLEQHPFPGAVAVDFREGAGMGDTNVAYSTIKFNLPRLLLLDIDGKVVWEGDPGFSSAQPYRKGVETYLDTPLDELIERRKIKQLTPWIAAWNGGGARALSGGDLARALPLLVESRAFDPEVLLEVRQAQRKLSVLDTALADIPGTVEAISEEGREPALAYLKEWAAIAEVELDRADTAALSRALKGKPSKAWTRALKQVDGRRKKIEADVGAAAELAESLRGLDSAFATDLADALDAAAGDAEAVARVLDGAPELPKRWLASAWFNW